MSGAVPYLILIPSVIVAVELLLRLNLMCRMRRLNGHVGKAVRVLASKKISDHWKEFVLRRYALHIAAETSVMMALIVMAVIVFGGIYAGLNVMVQGQIDDILSALMTLEVQVATIAYGLIYVSIRGRFVR